MTTRHSLQTGLVLLQLTLAGFNIPAATNVPPAPPDRYLLVVDTSSPMRTKADALKAAVGGLLQSGMQGEIHNGDQLGVWTFNTDLHTGDFDLVIWKDAAREEIRDNVLEFLEKQRFRKSTDFSRVMPDLMDVVGDSKRITVILFSDGDEAITGTPFDAAIAAYFRENADGINDKRAPIVTVLRGYEGELIGYTMSYPPWPVEFPTFPPEPEPEPDPPTKPPRTTSGLPTRQDLSRTLVTTNTGPIVFAEPLIVRGPSRETAPPAAAPPVVTNEITTHESVASTNEVSSLIPAPAEATSETHPGEGPRFRAVSLIAVAGGIFVLVLLVAGFMAMRRPRTKRRASLITRSMDKKDGPE
jgi:hypothetical protein